MRDPFAALDMPVTFDIDAAELERRYLQRSRTVHPDHNPDGDPEARLATLTAAAELNDAYRTLRDPWLRAQALIELCAPGEIGRRKQLAPGFLMGVMDLAERVAATAPDSDAGAALTAELEQLVRADLARVRTAIAAEDWPTAATQLQQSNYHRKALRDLHR